jgi:hypothetical protein
VNATAELFDTIQKATAHPVPIEVEVMARRTYKSFEWVTPMAFGDSPCARSRVIDLSGHPPG